MTRIDVTPTKLARLVEDHSPGWLVKAKAQIQAIKDGTAGAEFPPLWSAIKDVYIALQGGGALGKCAYCEKWLEADRIEHDVEHFRPKAKVARWKIPKDLGQELAAAGVEVKQPDAGAEPGYRFLAYHLLNYATACKQCNSVLKRNLFPIGGRRLVDAKDPAKMKDEGALLIYPIGRVDDKPESLIIFHGVSPQASGDGFGRLRALATIEIFRLDDWRSRKTLLLDRAEWIEKLWWALRQRDGDGPPGDVANAEKAVARLTAPTARHASCLSSFKRLYERDRAEAGEVYEGLVKKYLNSYKPR